MSGGCLEGRLVSDDRLRVPPEFTVAVAEIVVSICKRGAELDRRLVFRYRFGVLALDFIGDTQVVVGSIVVLIDFKNFSILIFRLVILAEGMQTVSEIEPCPRVVRVEFDRVPQLFNRFVIQTFTLHHNAQVQTYITRLCVHIQRVCQMSKCLVILPNVHKTACQIRARFRTIGSNPHCGPVGFQSGRGIADRLVRVSEKKV